MAPKYPAIPEPTTDVQSLRDSVLSIKQFLEILTGQRGNPDYAAASTVDIGNINDSIDGITGDIGDINTALATKVAKAGDTMTGALNVPASAAGTQAPQVQEVVKKAGDTMTGLLTLSADPSTSLQASTKQYTDSTASSTVNARAVRYDAAQTLTSDQQAQARANISAPKWNRFINSGLQISQENGATALTATGGYPADGWFPSWPTGTYTYQLVASPTPGGGPNRIRVTVTGGPGSVGATDYFYFGQNMEGLRVADLRSGSAAAKTVTIRFGVKCPTAGTYSVCVRNGANNRSYVTTYTIASGEVNQDVIKSVTIPLDQSGTWPTDNSTAIAVGFVMYCGSTYTTAPNVWTAGNFLNATGAGVNLSNTSVWEFFEPRMDEGTVAQPFVLPDYPAELATCMRYFQFVDGGIWSMNAAGITSYYFTNPFKVEMRAAPSFAQVTAPTLVTCTSFGPNAGNTTNRTVRFDMAAGAAGMNYAQGGQWKFLARP